MEYIIRYLVAAVVFIVIDSVWLGIIANKLYKSQIGHLLADKPNLIAAGVFYALFIVGIVVFVLNPAISSSSWKLALGLGALFGLITYATYDLTNLSTLKDFPLKITIIDLIWGTVLTASVSLVSYLIITKWL